MPWAPCESEFKPKTTDNGYPAVELWWSGAAPAGGHATLKENTDHTASFFYSGRAFNNVAPTDVWTSVGHIWGNFRVDQPSGTADDVRKANVTCGRWDITGSTKDRSILLGKRVIEVWWHGEKNPTPYNDLLAYIGNVKIDDFVYYNESYTSRTPVEVKIQDGRHYGYFEVNPIAKWRNEPTGWWEFNSPSSILVSFTINDSGLFFDNDDWENEASFIPHTFTWRLWNGTDVQIKKKKPHDVRIQGVGEVHGVFLIDVPIPTISYNFYGWKVSGPTSVEFYANANWDRTLIDHGFNEDMVKIVVMDPDLAPKVWIPKDGKGFDGTQNALNKDNAVCRGPEWVTDESIFGSAVSVGWKTAASGDPGLPYDPGSSTVETLNTVTGDLLDFTMGPLRLMNSVREGLSGIVSSPFGLIGIAIVVAIVGLVILKIKTGG